MRHLRPLLAPALAAAAILGLAGAALAGVRAMQPDEVRELLAAGRAPGRPEIDQDDAALLGRHARREAFRVELPGKPGGLCGEHGDRHEGGDGRQAPL